MKNIFKGCYALLLLIAHLFMSYVRMIKGVWKISKLSQPIVTIFGGSKLHQDHEYSKKAYDLGVLLVSHNVSVITGGGPGIMEAASCGAFKKKEGVRSIGITVKGLENEAVNSCADDMLVVKHFFTRKWLLTRYSNAFVVCPGGFGTLDELFEITTLMQVDKMEHKPVVLIGVEYWQPLLKWMEKAIDEGLLLQKDMDLLYVTDDIKDALKYLNVSK